jgi:hypothetical protein
MTIDMDAIRTLAAAAPGGLQDKPGEVVDLKTRVHTEVLKYFPKYDKKGPIDPPYTDAFPRGLLQLPLKQPQAGAGAESNQRLIVENRRMVYEFIKNYSAGTDKTVYKKLIEKAIVLIGAREQLAEGGSGVGIGQGESATLNTALTATFTSIFGMSFLSTGEFFRAMMLGDEKFEIDDEW